jgi:uncharacterized protein YyaL (SSP411 family)
MRTMPDTPHNRLNKATSPYLLQHADNPVHWYEWGPEAFEAAQAADKPILLSVGYASCHWCHVMAHESFEDPATADAMNRLFVNVKVDREERPDVDRIYMDAVQAVTGRGGWPMTVFLTPDGEPFHAGTYFPPDDRHGMPSFRRVMEAVHATWTERRTDIVAHAGRLAEAIRTSIPPADDLPAQETLERAYLALEAAYDEERGGFGAAPKFPQAPTLEFLLRVAGRSWAPRATEMLESTLVAMARGGIYDHLGGGFARYSVDGAWLVPHFEKMLYDNALLARLYVRAFQVTGNERFERVARETLAYLERDLGLPGGGFASAEDADSEGIEGRFYVFSYDEFMRHGGEAVALAARFFGISEAGNFEGSNVLHEARTTQEVAADAGTDERTVEQAVAAAKQTLLSLRATRVRPAMDDKAVCAWNGLAIRAFAEAGEALNEPAYLDTARSTARFVLTEMRRADGRLLRAWRNGEASIPAFADDYAAMATGLLALYQATGEVEWFATAAELLDQLIELFWDDEAGGVFASGHDAERLIARPKNLFDNPTPSDNSLAAEAVLHAGALTGDADTTIRLDAISRLAGQLLERAPSAVGHLLAVIATRFGQPIELAIVGDPHDPVREALEEAARDRFRPGVFRAVGDGSVSEVPLLTDRPAGPNGTGLAYVCRGFVCDAPVADPASLRVLLDGP